MHLTLTVSLHTIAACIVVSSLLSYAAVLLPLLVPVQCVSLSLLRLLCEAAEGGCEADWIWCRLPRLIGSVQAPTAAFSWGKLLSEAVQYRVAENPQWREAAPRQTATASLNSVGGKLNVFSYAAVLRC